MDALLDVVREKNPEKLETAVSKIPGIERIINEPDWNVGGKLFLIEVVKTNQQEYLNLILDSQVCVIKYPLTIFAVPILSSA